MIRINVLCEGTTEYDFVRKVLYDHFIAIDITLIPHNLGGGFNYESLRHQIVKWLNSEHGAYVTTMIDLYGMNNDYPEYTINRTRPAIDKVEAIENAIKKDVSAQPYVHNNKFIPYVQLYEFEALLYSEPGKLEEWLSLEHSISSNSFSAIRNAFNSPEEINDSKHTAPSKRIIGIASSYDKVAEGVTIASDIGLSKLREECKHFDAWITKLEILAAPPTPSIA